MPFVIRSSVPDDIDPLITIRSRDEIPAHQLGGDDDELEKVWNLVLDLYKSGIHPALTICIRRHGEIVMHRSIGYAHGNGPNDEPEARKVKVTPGTPFNIYSASKALTATLIHLLDERNILHVDDYVCDYIPEFASHGKDQITIKHILNHRAGIADVPKGAMHLDILSEPERLLQLMCEIVPSSRAGGRLAYHAITGGFVLAEVVERVTGKNIRQVMHEEVVEPLGFRWTNYGVAKKDVNKVASNYFTGVPILPPLTKVVEQLLGIQMDEAVELSNDSRFLTAVIPSANIVTTADELCLFYQMLLNGGELNGTRILEPRTIRRATAEQSWMEPDSKLIAPIRYSQGFMLGADYVSVFGPDTDKVFGHIGLTNVFAWADPERQIAGALMTSGKPLVYPEIWSCYSLPWQVATALDKTQPRRRPTPIKRRRKAVTKKTSSKKKRTTKRSAKRRQA